MPISESRVNELFTAAMQRVYLWMALGLLLTTGAALVVVNSPTLLSLIFGTPLVWGLLIGEIILVMVISAAINRLSPIVALGLFFLYSAVNGLTLSVIFFAYELGTITLAFGSSAVLFGVMSFIGFVTKEDLTSWGRILFMALIGLIIASVANIFLANSTLDWIITYAGILIFLALTVYDTQRIKVMTYASAAQGMDQVVSRIGVLGALKLYLDFINLFLFMLRLFGGRRR
jgi:FtsH-binding integral membrane protein